MNSMVRWLAACFVIGSSLLGQQDDALVAELRLDDYVRVVGHGASSTDIAFSRHVVGETIVRLRAIFGRERAEKAWTGIECVVNVHGKATTEVDDGRALLRTGTGEKGYKATIDVLGPSGWDPTFRNLAGHGSGTHHFAKVLAHEYATVLLDRLTRAKPTGWTFFAAPAWFVQGYEEYLGVWATATTYRDEVIASYARRLEDQDRVRFHPTFTVADEYLDGAVFVHFLHEVFGGDRVRAVLDAPQAEFEAALLATLDVTWPLIETRWKEWREEALARSAWQVHVAAAKTPAEIATAVRGQDLKNLPEAMHDKVIDALRTLAGKDEYWRSEGDGSPHRVVSLPGGKDRWALVVSGEGMSVPGVSWLAVHLFDAQWQQTQVVNFPTGYRIALFDVWVERVDALPDPVIVVRLGSIGSFGDYTYRQRQYYAVRDGRVLLLRVEDEGGGATTGSFAASHPWTGPKVVERTAEQWHARLASKDAAECLEALTWLAGLHLSSSEEREPNVSNESVEDSRRWEAALAHAPTRALLQELAKSPQRWIREGAELALRGAK